MNYPTLFEHFSISFHRLCKILYTQDFKIIEVQGYLLNRHLHLTVSKVQSRQYVAPRLMHQIGKSLIVACRSLRQQFNLFVRIDLKQFFLFILKSFLGHEYP